MGAKTRPIFGYPFIVLWGLMLGSHPSYIDDERDAAQREGAPQTAIYSRSRTSQRLAGTRTSWETITDIRSPLTIDRLLDLARDRKYPVEVRDALAAHKETLLDERTRA